MAAPTIQTGLGTRLAWTDDASVEERRRRRLLDGAKRPGRLLCIRMARVRRCLSDCLAALQIEDRQANYTAHRLGEPI